LVNEISARHQRDLEYVRNLNRMIPAKDEADAGRPIPIRGEAEELRRKRMAKPMPMTDEEEAQPPRVHYSDAQAPPPASSRIIRPPRTKLPDPLTFMESVRRKAAMLQTQPQQMNLNLTHVTISEGPLSPSSSCTSRKAQDNGDREKNAFTVYEGNVVQSDDLAVGTHPEEAGKMVRVKPSLYIASRFLLESNQ
jgi:hypothetical protein